MTEFGELHRLGRPLLLPNAWDVASAFALAEAGFMAVGTTSLGVAAANGVPDGVGLARAETLELVRRLRGLPVPLTVDVESAGSDFALELYEAGAAGINVEDGRAGGGLASIGEQVEVIGAIKQAAPRLFVNARVDTYWLGVDRSETKDRAEAYLAAGADGVFVPGVRADDEIRALPGPLNVLLLPGMTVGHLAGLGVARISMGSLLYRAALDAALVTAVAIQEGASAPADVRTYAETDRFGQAAHGGR
ncbi:isocitrate lyase/phosphoenolpyruvate mutase family protein [Actinoplanes sp. NPDC049596]|uniref:isocitrate lyase/PEP mutase family protein n=1 Tax=unclassified Actinoplanes TaxID=2626549 RepID=UPI003437EB6B